MEYNASYAKKFLENRVKILLWYTIHGFIYMVYIYQGQALK